MLGEKIAEGTQAEIYRATYPEDKFSESEVILKVFKLEGASLRDLQHQLSRGLVESDMFTRGYFQNVCLIHCARSLDDGRFAFEMDVCWGICGSY